ncbi:amidohydrolase family protein [Chitinophaga ginsengisoli]|uniref:Imidazolonepropionase-like amidohydrolase n=1 Tax=Chitinophaga ginsengisoli TaxID=363837 RepID=A0A2P8FGK7_9BACT|nr:amidohydrolase family protein [Chitinophaga ginsengisoli]PSL20840.1 imidazolonepropionase-like amidohydrolase [Chitinophaga ginsengisoli]
MLRRVFLSVCLSAICYYTYAQDNTSFILKDITLIDGSGAEARSHVSLVVTDDTIAAILPAGTNYPVKDAEQIDGQGMTVMPLLVNGHGHVGLLQGTTIAAANYTPENVNRHLMQYLEYGVGTVLSLGTDQPAAFIFKDASRMGMLPGASFYTAGYGFGTPKGVPPVAFGPSILRPVNADQALQDMRRLVVLKPDFIKIWVDGTPRMLPEIYHAIITEAHAHNIKVAAHVYYLEDAHKLVDAGIDVLAHSIRDQEVDDSLIIMMKQKNICYIPTLCIEEFAFAYASLPEWFPDPFFVRSLEPGVSDLLKSEEYRKQNSEERERKMQSLQIASRNLHKMDSAGVKIVMGTDSGAQPVRAIGFSEHMELQLMTEAGIPPLRVIQYATYNGAAMLGIEGQTGSLLPGKKADFMILDANPLLDIRATRSIKAIYKNGKQIQ